MELSKNMHDFLIEVASHNMTLDLFTQIMKKFNIANINTHDSSYYINDTYWIMNQGFWSVQFYYTACLDSENSQICGKVHLVASIKSDILPANGLLLLCNYLKKLIEEKHKIILEPEIYPNLSDEEHALFIKFLEQ